MSDQPSALKPGDKVPFCYGMSGSQGYYSFEDQLGRPAVLILAGSQPPAALAGLIEAFAARAEAFAAQNADIRVLAMAGAAGWPGAQVPPRIGLVPCMDAGLFNATGGEAGVLVMGRAGWLVSRPVGGGPADIADRALADLAATAAEPPRDVSCPAPVLVRPGLFDVDLRQRLIAHFEAGEHSQGAVAGVDADMTQVNRIDEAKKRRRDLVLEASDPLHAEVADALTHRLIPEIARAFNAEVEHLDRILIARYDDDGGHFRRHRDNASAHLAWREFALSANLNTGEYDGGRLRFPEYSDDLYNPPAGSACVFSASLLHEATPVTRGRRYVLLTFLHGARAEAQRLQTRAA